ncbi:flavin-containing monooxygenase [Elysia marginata]|uniref:Flavin-containing monooxygenase n=1 Tax=Elysia marginata TaxID=1093978 RepID=A0AAV4JBK0_9GAST|nr:flavin-containing monooxygenase [Elysia marginata]
MGKMQVVRVAIIGAGGGGLCALRHLMGPRTLKKTDGDGDHQGVQFEAVCFEQAAKVGGTWAYTDQVGRDEHGNSIHSSMYKNLKTNLPKQCMAFPDFPFHNDLPSFIGHEDVQNYLEDYADSFGILKYIQFYRQVQLVKPMHDKDSRYGLRWEVTTRSVLDPQDDGETDVYDAVLMGNGNYAIPFLPTLPGSESYEGQIVHSHNYRRPEPYRDQVVVMLGANASGQDIALELSDVAKKVYISHNKAHLQSRFPDNVKEKPGIERLDANYKITFLDNTSVNADSLILCTGYHYDYSFLAPECGIEVKDFRVTPLYKHLVNTKFPTMAVLGICKRIVPFPFFDIQVQFFRAVLEGSVVLPNEADMNEDTECDYQERLSKGRPHRYSHEMSGCMFQYLNELADMACVERIPKNYEVIYDLVAFQRKTDVMNYKKMNFALNDKGDGYVVL